MNFFLGSEGGLKNNYINKILDMLDAHMRQYIPYYFQKRIVNLTKTKKAHLKIIMYPIIVEYY